MSLGKKRSLKVYIPIILLIGFLLLAPLHQVEAGLGDLIIDSTIGGLLSALGSVLRTFGAWLLSVTAIFFEWVLKKTIAEAGTGNLGFGDEGLGPAINRTWGTIRDLANAGFIFVLLYAAIRVILDMNTAAIGSTIKNIVIVTLLINFSLFGTKVIIDTGNIPTIGFYNAIIEASDAKPIEVLDGFEEIEPGITNVIMSATNLQSFWSGDELEMFQGDEVDDDTLVFINGIFSAVLSLVLSVILFMISIMFVSRHVILIPIMVLSPLACICYIVPGLQNRFWEWLSNLKNQVFFPPLFMMMLWVSIQIIAALGGNSGINWSSGGTNPKVIAGLILNYALVIGFLVMSLIMAKQMATKSFGKDINKYVGMGTIGLAAFGMRKTVGFAGDQVARSTSLRLAASNKESDAFSRGAARLALYAGDKARKGTFDLRNASIPTGMLGDAVRGTVGRTGWGKKIGLDDINTSDIGVAKGLMGNDLGKAGEKGYKELKEESKKRIRERETEELVAARMAENKEKIKKGSKDGADPDDVSEMERALAKISDKETEALLASNRGLLDSLNFANALSVKQLEAINKSDTFSDVEKDRLKNARFKDINDAMKSGDPIRIQGVKGKIKDLKDAELDMIDSSYLGNEHFVAEMKASQIEAVNKSGKFSSSDRANLKKARTEPLKSAIGASDSVRVGAILKKMGPKEVAALDLDDFLKKETMIESYTPQLLKRIAPEMGPSAVIELRAEIESVLRRKYPSGNPRYPTIPEGHPTLKWLADPVASAAFS